MGLDQELIKKARELYKWEICFQGGLESNLVLAVRADPVRDTDPLIERPNWICNRRHPTIGIGSYPMERRKISYGFIDLGSGKVQPYLPFAEVYPGRIYDHKEELLYEALLCLRKMVSSKPAYIRFPDFLAKKVGHKHLSILEPDNPEIKKHHGRIAGIIRPHLFDEDMKEILREGRLAFVDIPKN